MSINKEFKKELKALLEKYNATIGFTCADCSDTYGLYGEAIEITTYVDRKQQVLVHVDGWTIDKSDLK